jgi:hypothetical protein
MRKYQFLFTILKKTLKKQLTTRNESKKIITNNTRAAVFPRQRNPIEKEFFPPPLCAPKIIRLRRRRKLRKKSFRFLHEKTRKQFIHAGKKFRKEVSFDFTTYLSESLNYHEKPTLKGKSA